MNDPDALVGGADISFGDSTMHVRVGSAETDGAFTLLEESVPAGSATSTHRHHGMFEVFYVLEGIYTFNVGGRVMDVGPGGVAMVQPGEAHQWTAGPDGGRSLILFSPGGAEGYFQELAEAIRRGGITQAFRDRMRAAYQIEILDPLPE